MATYQEHKLILFVSTGVLAISAGQALRHAAAPSVLSWILFLPALTVQALSYALDCPFFRMRQRVVRSVAIWSFLLAIHFIPLVACMALLHRSAAFSPRTAMLMLGVNLLLQLLTLGGTRFWVR